MLSIICTICVSCVSLRIREISWNVQTFICHIHKMAQFKSVPVCIFFLGGVTGPVRASAAASSGASAASSSAAEERCSLCKNTQLIVPQHCWGYIKAAAAARYSLFIKRVSPPLTSSSFILMSFSVSASGVEICSSGMGLSTRWSAFILLEDKSWQPRSPHNHPPTSWKYGYFNVITHF